MKPSFARFVGGLSLLVSTGALAQVYTVQSQSMPYAPISGGSTLVLQQRDIGGFYTADDEGYADLALGFTFPYYGQNYTSVHVDSNGFLLLGNATKCNGTAGGGSGFDCYDGAGFPSLTRLPHNVIAGWWDDQYGPTGSVKYKASAGQMEIEYSNWACYGGGCGFTYKIVLTASGLFQVHYGSFTGSTSSASAGWENQTGTAGGSWLSCATTTSNCTQTHWQANTLFTIGQPVQPDVVVSQVNIANLVVGGSSITFDVTPTFQNFGQNPATGPFAWKAYLSTDKTLVTSGAGADVLVYTSTPSVTLTGAGTAGATTTATGAAATPTLPPPGQYYVLVEADTTAAVTEASETNNVGSTTNYFVNGLDLVATSLSGPANSGPGNPIVVNVSWFNQGTSNAGSVEYRVLLSTDAIASTNDFVLFSGTKTVTGGQTVNEPLSITVPGNVPGGDFNYILQIDPNGLITEASELNNTAVSTSKVNMKQADLVNLSADFLDPVTNAPTRIGYFGQAAKATVSINNTGGANANNFKVGVVISTDATLSLLSDTIAVEQVVPLVAQGATVTVDVPFTMPLKDRSNTAFPTGNYYIYVILDSTSAVTELNEQNNNLQVVGTVSLRAPAPDLTVTKLEAAATGAVGEVIPVLRTLKNIGNVDAPAVKYRYFASANPIITTDDVPLQIVNGANMALDGTVTLAIGAADTQTELVKLPAGMTPGAYQLGCIIDTGSAVAEIEEGNNALASNTVQVAASSLRVVTAMLPDAVVDRPYSYRLVALGEQGAASTWAIDPSQGALPMGLSLGTDGLLSGTPPTASVTAFTVVVTNNGRDAAARLVLRVLPTTTQVEITTTAVTPVINTPALKYEYSLGAAGGVKPYVWKIAAGTLPQNLTLSTDGLISGNPKLGLVEGASNVTVEVQDSLGTRASKSLSIRVVAPGSIVFRNLQLSSGLVGENYFTDVAVQNADMTPIVAAQKPLIWSKQGELPDGLALNTSGEVALIEGKPLRAGTFTFTLSVEDAKGRNDSAEFMIRISPARFKISTENLSDVAYKPGEPVNFALKATTEANPKFNIYAGNLAPGLTMAADGKVSGMIANDISDGRFNFVVEARDDTGATGLGAFSMEVKREIKQQGCASTGFVGGLWMLALLVPVVLRRKVAVRKAAMAAGAFALLALPSTGFAQVDYQVVGPTPTTYTTLTNGNQITICGSVFTNCIYQYQGAAIPLSFPFSFYGQPVSQVTMTNHGYLVISGYDAATTNQGIPHSQTLSGSYPITYIAPWWDALAQPAANSPAFRYQTFGVSPNRYMVFEWNQLAPQAASTSPKFSFQVILFETTYQIRFVYGSVSPQTGSASVGIQKTTSVGVSGLGCTTASSGACGTANYPANMALDFFLPPDLQIASVSGDQTGFGGVGYRATALVKNVGGRVASNVTVRFYLSANATYEPTDTAIGDGTVASIPAGGEALVTGNSPIPAASVPGSYFVVARVDPDNQIVEQSEANNTGTPTQMNIGPPTPDLVVASVTSPMTGTPGGTVAVGAALLNSGNAAAGAFKYTWFISDNSVVTISDQKLSPIGNVASLAPQAIATPADMVALPSTLTAGQYWIGACVNYDPTATPEFGIAEITQVNNCATATQPILVSTGQVAVITTTLPPATQYSPYGLRLKASGGNGSYTWTQMGGTLPPGISLSPAGDLQGTPASAGTFSFDVRVSSAGADATGSLSMMVTSGTLPLAVVDQDLPAAEFSRSYLADLVAVGGKPPYIWTLKPDNRLPVGLALSTEGQIEGRASEGGDFLFGVVCTDSAGKTSSKDLKLKVVNPATLHIATAGLATGYLKQSYLHTLQAVGGKAGYDWSLVRFQQLAENVTEQDGAPLGDGKTPIPFPATIGLKIEDGGNGSDYLRGTPKQAGLYLLTLKVVDAAGAEDFTQLLLRVSYVEGLAITTTALPDAFAGLEYAARLGHNGGKDAVVTFSVPCVKEATGPGMFACASVDPKQSVPPGLVLEADGTLKGTPTGDPGNYAFLVKVVDENGRQDVRSLSVKIRPDWHTTQKQGGCSVGGLELSALALLFAARLVVRRRKS